MFTLHVRCCTNLDWIASRAANRRVFPPLLRGTEVDLPCLIETRLSVRPLIATRRATQLLVRPQESLVGKGKMHKRLGKPEGILIVRYQVKAERAAENVEYGRRVFAALAESAPEGLRYATFQADDGVSFTHVVSLETQEGTNALASTPEFEQFEADLKDRCEVPPVATFVSLVGSYNFME